MAESTRSRHTLRARIALLASRLSEQPSVSADAIVTIAPERVDVDIDDDCNLGTDCGGSGHCASHWMASVRWQHDEQFAVFLYASASTKRGALLALRDRLRGELRRRINEDRAALGIRVRTRPRAGTAAGKPVFTAWTDRPVALPGETPGAKP